MFEWLDGYWTAMRHVATASTPETYWQNAAVWVSAIGSLSAAIAAAVAAFLTWKISDRSWKATIVAEKASIMREYSDLSDDLHTRAIDAAISSGNWQLRAIGIKKYQNEMSKALSVMANAGEEYTNIAKSIDIGEGVKKAVTAEDLQTLRLKMISIRTVALQVDLALKTNQNIAAVLIKGAEVA